MDSSKENTNFDPRYDSGSGLTPVVVGGTTAALGTIGVSHLMHREGRVQKNLAKAYEKLHTAEEKRDEKVEKIDGKLKPTDRVKKDNYESALSEHKFAQGFHQGAANNAWYDVMNGLDGAVLAKVEIDTAKGELKHLEKNTSPREGFARDHAIESVTARIKAVEQAVADAQASGHSVAAYDVKEAVTRATLESVESANRMTDEHFYEVAAFGHKHGNAIRTAGIKAREEANPALHAQALASIPDETHELKEAAQKLEQAEKEWLPRRDKLYGGAQKAVGKAETRVERLMALDAINTEKGFLHEMARPVNLYREAGSGTRFGLLATAVTLGTAAYGVTRAITAPKREAAFTDNVPAMDNTPIQR